MYLLIDICILHNGLQIGYQRNILKCISLFDELSFSSILLVCIAATQFNCYRFLYKDEIMNSHYNKGNCKGRLISRLLGGGGEDLKEDFIRIEYIERTYH